MSEASSSSKMSVASSSSTPSQSITRHSDQRHVWYTSVKDVGSVNIVNTLSIDHSSFRSTLRMVYVSQRCRKHHHRQTPPNTTYTSPSTTPSLTTISSSTPSKASSTNPLSMSPSPSKPRVKASTGDYRLMPWIRPSDIAIKQTVELPVTLKCMRSGWEVAWVCTSKRPQKNRIMPQEYPLQHWLTIG